MNSLKGGGTGARLTVGDMKKEKKIGGNEATSLERRISAEASHQDYLFSKGTPEPGWEEKVLVLRETRESQTYGGQ